jgi:hypothetical protein
MKKEYFLDDKNKNYPYLSFSFSEKEKIFAIKTAILKSQHTIDHNQNGIKRNFFDKFNKQLQGILAEISVKKILERVTTDLSCNVMRYDEVRTDNFASPKGEYDLKIKTKNKEVIIEVRSSMFYKDLKLRNIKKEPIIGSYTNNIKKTEKPSDMFFRPFIKMKKSKTIIEGLENNDLEIIIPSACTINHFNKNGYVGNLGQSNTEYNLVNISENTNIINFCQNLKKYLMTLDNKPDIVKNKKKYRIN